jgi:GDP-mannose 6-dehydrogenase
MKIVICGLGYVGATIAACLVRDGHSVAGIDPDGRKVADIAAGRSPVTEPGVEALLTQGIAQGRLTASTELGTHLTNAYLVFICVGTPSMASGSLDLSQIKTVLKEVGDAIAALPADASAPLIVLRSTVPPRTMDDVVVPTLTAAVGEAPGHRYEIAFNPEFLRETTAISDYDAPAKIVIGEREPGATNRLLGLYDAIDAPVFELPFAAAEMIKFTDNAFHALKVAFGNEIGRLALDLEVDPQPVMEAFLTDTKLNISPRYFRPGGPFGGSCLPKDVRAINALAASRGIDVPVLSATLSSNAAHTAYLAARVMAGLKPGASVLLLGLSFKTGTDDLRESPLVDLAETLIGKGYDLKIYDPDLKGRVLIGANLRFIEERLPHLSRLLVDDIDAVPSPDLIVIGKRMSEVEGRLDAAIPKMDLVRLELGPA